jgi:hypothetical protein
MKKWSIVIILVLSIGILGGLYFLYRTYFSTLQRSRKVMDFLKNPTAHQASVVTGLTRCGEAPFLLPTSGLIGFLWDDSFRIGHHHQGIDIFSGTDVGEMPIYAAYDGYLTRMSDWKSSVIIRIPADPLQPDRQIWTYYTHMADESGESLIDAAYPPGTADVFVAAGTRLGYQGNYSGRPDQPTGVHLHFSIVKDDGQGKFLNELEIGHTLDPSSYFGMPLNGKQNKDLIPQCAQIRE